MSKVIMNLHKLETLLDHYLRYGQLLYECISVY